MEFDANEQALRESGRYALDQVGSQAAGLLGWLYGVRDRARDAGDTAQQRVAETRDSAGQTIRQHPFGAVALALAIGFAAGVLIGRR